MSHALENVPLLLATGQGRSGTTVLTKALAEHPSIYSNRVESNVMKDVLAAGHASSSMASRVRQMVLSRPQHDLVFRRMLLDLLFPVDQWREDSRPLALSTFSAMNPAAAEFATAVFPGIHFANIVRHGVEVVASRMVHRSLGRHSFEEHCRAWAAAQEMAEWGADREDFSLIRHEDLLVEESCVSLFQRLFEDANLPPSDASSQYVLNHKFNQTVYDQETDLDSENLSGRARRWQLWNDQQRQEFERICGPTMEYFGYEFPA